MLSLKSLLRWKRKKILNSIDGLIRKFIFSEQSKTKKKKYWNYYNLFCYRCEGEDVRLMLWDTAGQEEFDAITKAYYRGAQACVLAFSTTDRDSFEAIHSWKLKVWMIINL